ncbi:MAG: hypothetical protein JNM22_06275 [Saprospiraceae bacterium]|nr:hypothetical protein [Saprospiraceae bacterium]
MKYVAGIKVAWNVRQKGNALNPHLKRTAAAKIKTRLRRAVFVWGMGVIICCRLTVSNFDLFQMKQEKNRSDGNICSRNPFTLLSGIHLHRQQFGRRNPKRQFPLTLKFQQHEK